MRRLRLASLLRPTPSPFRAMGDSALWPSVFLTFFWVRAAMDFFLFKMYDLIFFGETFFLLVTVRPCFSL